MSSRRAVGFEVESPEYSTVMLGDIEMISVGMRSASAGRERSEANIVTGIQIEKQMSYPSDPAFGAFAAAGTKQIGSNLFQLPSQ
jgi:hypothetical protein